MAKLHGEEPRQLLWECLSSPTYGDAARALILWTLTSEQCSAVCCALADLHADPHLREAVLQVNRAYRSEAHRNSL